MSEASLPCPRPDCDGLLVQTDGGLAVTGVQFTAASDWHREQGLLGFIRCVIDGRLVLDGITLRRTLDNRFTLSYPEREDAVRRRHPIIRPIDDEARRGIEAAIFGSLGLSKAS